VPNFCVFCLTYLLCRFKNRKSVTGMITTKTTNWSLILFRRRFKILVVVLPFIVVVSWMGCIGTDEMRNESHSSCAKNWISRRYQIIGIRYWSNIFHRLTDKCTRETLGSSVSFCKFLPDEIVLNDALKLRPLVQNIILVTKWTPLHCDAVDAFLSN